MLKCLALTFAIACSVTSTSAQPGSSPPKIVLVGDSTVATEGGWGPAFCAATSAICVDEAVNGRSTKSFLDEGLWTKALAEHAQFYFIQFGHNDGKPDAARHSDPGTTFSENLRRYIADARKINATPILVSSLSRRNYQDGKLREDDLQQYAAATRRVAAEQNVPFLDLYTLSTRLLQTLTQQQADAFNATTHADAAAENPGPAKPDRTHLNDRGKAVFGRMVADEAARTIPALKPYIHPAIATVDPTNPSAFPTLQAALDQAHAAGQTIRIAPGTYREKLRVATPNIHLIGIGQRPEDVILTWNDSAASAGGTGKSGTLTVNADGFQAENLTIQNTWEREHTRTEEGSQAVALLLNSDRAVFDQVRLLAAQDTLYANSRTCHDSLPADGTAPKTPLPPCQASRQLFHDCYIEGHVDYIFGDAKAVFDRCELHSLHHDTVMITAQSRHYPTEDSGYTFLHCRITGPNQGDRIILGRPWRDFSTVLFYDTQIDQTIAPEGWSDWSDRLRTSTYREYRSHGPGTNPGHRIVSYPPLTTAEEASLTPGALLAGEDHWNPEADIAALRAMR